MDATQRQLVERHVWVADAVLRRYLRTAPREADEDELRSVAYEALVKAALSFDETGGAVFSTWAWWKVEGALIDHVRRLLGRKLVSSRRSIGPRRPPSAAVVSLHAPLATGEHRTLELGETLAADDTIEGTVTDRALIEWVLGELPPRERFVVVAVAAGYSQPEIAAALGVTAARVGQLHAKAASRAQKARGDGPH